MKSFKDYAKILEQLHIMDCDGSYIDFEEVTVFDNKVTQEFVIPLLKANDKKWFDTDELIAAYANAYAKTGFINGFIRAMYIMYKEAEKEAKVV